MRAGLGREVQSEGKSREREKGMGGHHDTTGRLLWTEGSVTGASMPGPGEGEILAKDGCLATLPA